MVSIGWEEEALCCVCLELYDDPVMLECGHNVCLQCAGKVHKFTQLQLSNGIICPQCRTETPLDSSGVAGLKRNFTLRNVVNRLKEDKKAKDAVVCGNCENPGAEFDCETCGFALCRACREGQHTKGGYKRHTIHPVGTLERLKPKLCPAHNKELDLYDTEKNVLVCIYCLQLGSHKTSLHSIIPLPDAVAKAKSDLLKAMEAAREGVSALDGRLEEVQKHLPLVETQLDEVERQIRTQCKELVEAVQDRERALLAEVEKVREERVKNMAQHSQHIKAMISYNEELLAKFSGVLESASHSDLLQAKALMLTRMDVLLTGMARVSLPTTVSEEIKAAFVSTEQLLSLISKFGIVDRTAAVKPEPEKKPVLPLPPLAPTSVCSRNRSGELNPPQPTSAGKEKWKMQIHSPEKRPHPTADQPPVKRSRGSGSSRSSGEKFSLRI